MMFRFAHPWLLLLLVPAAAVVFLEAWRARGARPSLRLSRAGDLHAMGTSLRARLAWLPWFLRAAALLLGVVALARPQSGVREEEVTTEGVDIVVCFDASGSMQAEDTPGRARIEVARETVSSFVRGRPNDRIGLVVFAETAFTRCPLTLDAGLLLSVIGDIRIAERNARTAIGMGLATSINRLRVSQAKSKVIVLLTDGRNNAGLISPLNAAEIARQMGIKVYAIGIGSVGPARFPVRDPLGGTRYVLQEVDIDEETLRQVAATTGGRAFRATDEDSLREIFGTIDALEKTEIRTRSWSRYTELFPRFLLPGAALLTAGLLLGLTLLRRIP